MDALELLRRDHDTVRDLFEQFEEAKEAKNRSGMVTLQEQIFHELRVHTAIEEEVFYPAAKEVGGEAEELVLEGTEEHHVVDTLMQEIEGIGTPDEQWTAKMTVLIENVEHHAEEEEEELFPQLREAFGDTKLAEMGEQLQEAKSRHEGASVSKDELYERAKERGIEGRSEMTKEELAQALGDD